MYGWIIASFESMILTKYGSVQWNKVKEIAGCSHMKTGEIIKNSFYSEEITDNLIEACLSLFQEIKQEELIENLGKNFINFIVEHGYESTIKAQGKTFSEFLINMNEPHRLLRSQFPKCHLPEFYCTKPLKKDGFFSFERETAAISRDRSLGLSPPLAIDDNNYGTRYSCTLHYYSSKGFLLAPMVIGLIKECGKWFYHINQCDFELNKQTNEEVLVHTIWNVSFSDSSSTATTGVTSGDSNHSSCSERRSAFGTGHVSLAPYHLSPIVRCPSSLRNIDGESTIPPITLPTSLSSVSPCPFSSQQQLSGNYDSPSSSGWRPSLTSVTERRSLHHYRHSSSASSASSASSSPAAASTCAASSSLFSFPSNHNIINK
jgi:hypothetical protein